MGGKCCNIRGDKELTIDDQINFLDQEDIWLRQSIEYHKKRIKHKSENGTNSQSIELISRELTILSAVSELSTFVKTSLDSAKDDISKGIFEKDFTVSLQPLIENYKNIKEMNFSDLRVRK